MSVSIDYADYYADVIFKSEAQETCYKRIVPWILDIYPPAIATPASDHPAVYLAFGSTLASVDVHPFGANEAAINVTATVVRGTSKMIELLDYLLEENNRLFFASFSIDTDGTILLRDTLLGSNCDKNELEMSIRTVVEYANYYDDIIVQRWSGERALDKPGSNGAASD